MIAIFDALRASDLPIGAVVSIGNFDGVHIGHRKILASVVERAAELDAPSVVVTFDPHPAVVLNPEGAPLALQTLPQRLESIEALGIGHCLIVRFNREFSLLPAEDFVRDFLVRRLGVVEVRIGRNFFFGHNREGSVDLLERLGNELGFAVVAIAEEIHDGEAIASSRIRREIAAGHVEAAARMLGRAFAITGTIARGERMGSRLGFPTLNFKTENSLLPQGGVYVSRVRFASMPQWWTAVTNIGVRPTLYENYTRMVESHVIDFSMDVYGEPTVLEFLVRLRDERRFASTVDLTTQIGADILAAREYFASLVASDSTSDSLGTSDGS